MTVLALFGVLQGNSKIETRLESKNFGKKINFCPQTFFATKINPANYANMFLTPSLNLIQNNIRIFIFSGNTA